MYHCEYRNCTTYNNEAPLHLVVSTGTSKLLETDCCASHATEGRYCDKHVLEEKDEEEYAYCSANACDNKSCTLGIKEVEGAEEALKNSPCVNVTAKETERTAEEHNDEVICATCDEKTNESKCNTDEGIDISKLGNGNRAYNIGSKPRCEVLHTNNGTTCGNSNEERHLEDLVTLKSKKHEKTNCESKYVSLVLCAEFKYALGNHAPETFKFCNNLVNQENVLELLKEAGGVKARKLTHHLLNLFHM